MENEKLKKSGTKTQKEEMQAVIDSIDKTDVEFESKEAVDSEELTEASKDADQTMDPFTENLEEGSKAYGSETKSDPELETNPDKRFSKKHEINEQELRENSQKNSGASS